MTLKTIVSRFALGLVLLPAAHAANAQNAPISAEPTHSLFRYVRDDAAPDKVTRVHINARHKAAVPIQQDIFGNFIEHLGGVVDNTMTAQCVFNSDLESAEGTASVPDGWELQNANWRTEGYHSAHSVRLYPDAADGRPSELRQTLYLRSRANTAVTASLMLRAPQAGGIVLLELRTPALAVTLRLRADSPDWKPQTFTLPAFPVPPAPRQKFTLTVRHSSGGPVDCDRLTLTTGGAVGAMSPDMTAKAKQWNIPILRWPGGNFASGYDWRDGIGPRNQRPTRRNDAWGGLEPNTIGTDEFLAFCDALHTQPQLTINAGNGTPKNAAAWVAYCNVRTDAAGEAGAFARMRAANGHPKPYRVKTWEIGNELYGGWQIGHTDPAGNAARFVTFRDAMRAVDPALRLIATGKGDEFTADGLRRNSDWNRALLRASLANGSTAPDYLSIHPLIPLPGSLRSETYEAQYESAMAHATFLSDTFIPALARQITDIEGPSPRTRIAATEWGLIVGGETWWKSPNHDSLAGAIYNALALNAFIRSSDWVKLANMTAFAHGGGIKRDRGILYVDPQYYTQQMYADAQPHVPLETTTEGPGRDVPQRGSLPAVANVPDVDVVSALGAKNRLVVFAVNRHLTAPRTVTITIDGFSAARLAAVMLTADTPKERNSAENPDWVAPRPFPLPISRLRSGTALTLVIPPHTLVALTFAP